jgi:hypothetical protein
MFITKNVNVATKKAVIKDIIALFKIYFGIAPSFFNEFTEKYTRYAPDFQDTIK